MKELKFVQLQKDNEEHYHLLESLMIPYNKELDNHKNRVTPKDFILKITRGMLNMQGPFDRHLELCYDGDKLIGFLYGKVDHEGHKGFIKPEYGYIMEFYVKPEYRRIGYGKAMFKRLELLFSSHGTKRMYLTADPVTGKPFWEAMGVVSTGEISPENKLAIYERDVIYPKEIINITISEYLTNNLVEKIALAQWSSKSPKWVNRIRRNTYEDKYFYNSFDVLATNQNEDIIGRLHCIQNENNKELWYYGDLFVISKYRRLGIAKQMVSEAIKRLVELGAKTLRSYISPENNASLMLQKNLGFIERPFQTFNNLINDGKIMFELKLPNLYSVISVTAEDAIVICMLYAQNKEVLHGKSTSLDEWKKVLSRNEPDEQNFLICKGCMPVAWLRINGLQNKDMAWISMLVVSDKHHRQGIGQYAVEFAENYVKDKGFSKLGIHTTEDNIPAQNLYKKCGYAITEYGECTTGDGQKRKGYTFVKEI